MNIDWEAEWDDLGNDDGESRVAEKNLAQSTQKIVREFRKWWNRYLPSFSTIPRLFADTSLRFNLEVLSKRYKRTSADALSRVEPKDVRLYLIFRLKSSPRVDKHGLRQSTAYSYYKTLQMVYQLHTKRQLGKPTNDIINAVSKHHLKEFRYYYPVAVIRFALFAEPEFCPFVCPIHEHVSLYMLTGS